MKNDLAKDSTIAYWLLAGLFLFANMAAWATPFCQAKSGTYRSVLLELYTSEGCNSCPPADYKLSQLKEQTEYAERIVPLAFHVDYWNSLGWADRFASPQNTQRQQLMAGLAKSSFVYTPQFLNNGKDWRNALALLGRDNKTPALADISLELGAPNRISLIINGSIRVSPTHPDSEGYLAIYENNLRSQVSAGENSGRTLHHDFVVRRLIGPLPIDKSGYVSLHQEISWNPVWKPTDVGIVAFVQEKTTGEILQALQRPACPS